MYIYIKRRKAGSRGKEREVFAKTYPREIGLTLETVRVYRGGTYGCPDGQGNR